MAQLDKLIKVMHDRGGSALTLTDGQTASLTVGGQTTALSKAELTGNQIVGLVREITPPELAPQIGGGNGLTFDYGAPSGPVSVSVQTGGGGTRVQLQPQTAAAPVAAPAAASLRRPSISAPGGRSDELDRLLHDLVETGGSDLHLRVGQPPLFRRDGQLVRLEQPAYDGDGVQSMLDAIMPEKDRIKHQDTGDADFAYEIPGVARFRVNAARDRRGPMAVLRVIPSVIPTCQQLDVTPEVQKLCYLSKGLVVVTGPTGSGKSTTLASLVNLMNEERTDHILTVEDPIEFVHESKKCLVTHRQVGLHTESFKSGLRAALREDPDIMLIGEMRDLETVAIAIETAETGHLVFGTLHTTTAVSTIDRIIDQFPGDRQAQIRVMLSESLRGVIAQTLCKKIGGGRVAAREIMLMTPAVSNLIRDGKTFQIPSIIQTSKKLGMVTLNDSLLDLVDRKLVEPKEAWMKAVDKAGLVSAMQARGHDCSFA